MIDKKALESTFPGSGEMARRMRKYPWCDSPLGDPVKWPQSLRSAVSFLLPSKAQIALFWGPELVTLYNDAYRPVLGAKHPGALGKPARETWAEIWHTGLNALFDGVLTTGEAFWAQARSFFLERHGYIEETYFDVSYDPVCDESGGIGGLFCIVSEVTGRVVGERRLRVLRDLGAIASRATSVCDVYRAAMEVLAASAEEIPFGLVFDGEQLVARYGLAGAPPAPSWDGELHIVSGEALAPFDDLHAGPWPEPIREVALVPFAHVGEPPRGGLVAGISPRRRIDPDYRDFVKLVAAKIDAAASAVRRSEEEHRRAEALAELDRAKTAFFSNVAHEFRTPLTLMLGPVEDILAKPSNEVLPQNRAALEVVHRNGQRLLRLVNTLLDFARIEAGRTQASFEPSDISTLTADLASNFRSACERAGLRLVVDCPAVGEAYVDREMWEKIVLNLLSNAFKFTLQGEIAVRLRQEGPAFELKVSDTGAGIPESSLPHVFERFHRVEGAQGRSHEGSGIGLALVQELVKVHGGTIRVESRFGEGTTFSLLIPAGSAHLKAERIRAPREAASTAARADAFVDEALSWLPVTGEAAPASKAGAPWVLLADDNADLREYARKLLTEHFNVETVADGEAALAAARAHKPDLVVTDIMMPRLDGFGLIRALRADEALRSIPVLALSARAGEEVRIEGLERGADDYLIKPFSARELLVRAEALLRSQRARLEAEHALRESEARAGQLSALYELTARLQRAASEAQIHEAALDAIMRATGCARAAILLFDEQGMMRFVAWRGLSEEYRRAVQGHSPWKSDEKKPQPFAIDAVERSDVPEPLKAALRREGIRALAFVPLLSAGRLIGKFVVYYDAPHAFSPEELNIALTIGVHVALGVERRQAEATLHESEQRLRIALESGRMGSWAWDIVTNRVSWSAGLEALHGLAPGTFDGTFAAFRRDIHPDDWPEVERRIARTLEGEDHHVEYRILPPAGGVIWVEGRGKPYRDAEDRLVRVVGVCADVTERKRAEASLLAHARQQETVAALGELALRQRDLQKVFEWATTEVARAFEVEYCKVLELLPGGKEVLLRAGVGWKPGLVGSVRVSTSLDSQAGYTLCSNVPVVVQDLRTEQRFRGPPLLTEHGVVSGMSCIIRGADGEPWGVIGTHATRRIEFTRDDVSFLSSVASILGHAVERERAESTLRDSDQRKDEFIAVLSHELRNPLAPLRNAAYLLQPLENSEARLRPIREMMQRQIDQLVRLVDDLLDLSRITRGSLELKAETVNVARIANSAIETATPAIRAAAHSLDVSLPSEPLCVKGDPLRLGQVLANLLNNAARYMDPDGKIQLDVQREGQNVLFSVRDNGIGFAAESIPEMFRMFTRSVAAKRRNQSGLGIGLALAKRLAEMHGGTLEGRSEGIGRGAVFVLKLPLAESTIPARFSSKSDAASAPGPLANRRILVVDDNVDAAESLAMVLCALGADVTVTNSGSEALAVYPTFGPAVTLLDIGMPDMDGYETAHEIRTRFPNSRSALIALTGWGQEQDREKSRAVGFDHHLVKPVDIDTLQKLLRELDHGGERNG